jgi:hypothetical protein
MGFDEDENCPELTGLIAQFQSLDPSLCHDFCLM